MSASWLLFGLGNPGPQYAATRHNVGQLALDELAARAATRFTPHRAGATVAVTRTQPGGAQVILAKSNGYMNTSGGPASALLRYYKIAPAQLIVLHDDLDLPFDGLKLKLGGGNGGHNGLRDIQKALQTPDFLRLRIGIGRPPAPQSPADFVLRPFTKAEQKTLPLLLATAADAALTLISEGLLAAQQQFHGAKR